MASAAILQVLILPMIELGFIPGHAYPSLKSEIYSLTANYVCQAHKTTETRATGLHQMHGSLHFKPQGPQDKTDKTNHLTPYTCAWGNYMYLTLCTYMSIYYMQSLYVEIWVKKVTLQSTSSSATCRNSSTSGRETTLVYTRIYRRQ